MATEATKRATRKPPVSEPIPPPGRDDVWNAITAHRDAMAALRAAQERVNETRAELAFAMKGLGLDGYVP